MIVAGQRQSPRQTMMQIPNSDIPSLLCSLTARLNGAIYRMCSLKNRDLYQKVTPPSGKGVLEITRNKPAIMSTITSSCKKQFRSPKLSTVESGSFSRGDRGWLLQCSVTFSGKYVRCIIYVNVYIKFIICVNKRFPRRGRL